MEAIIFLCIGAIVLSFVLGIAKGVGQNADCKEANESIKQKLKETGFNIEKEVGLLAKVYVDNTNKQWAVSEWNNCKDVKIYKYADLIDFELIEDDESLVKGGFGKAIIGGALGGTKGAVIGSAGSRKIKQNCSLLEVRIRTNDFEHPQYIIQYIKNCSFPKSSDVYKRHFESAQELIGILNYIATNGGENSVNVSPQEDVSVGTRLRELSELKNDGILTIEEFEVKKKKLLEKSF